MTEATRLLIQKMTEEGLHVHYTWVLLRPAKVRTDGSGRPWAIGASLTEGIGDTIRVSLSEPP
ncbi:MAG: hypothetical protein MZV63_62915 [Marinilabiliales bacterium]|nr:hypothetical protein [Marinilabiliales bacterium]